MRRRTSILTHLLLASLLVVGAAAASEARTRSFCGGFHSRTCGGHLQPACTSGAACNSGFQSYSGDPFPITIDCPWPIADNTVSSGCFNPVTPPDCSDCGGAGQPGCPQAAAQWCGLGCEAGLSPNPTTTLCEAPGTPGAPCGPGFPCAAGTTCDPFQLKCVAPAGAGESCANPFVQCGPGLVCTGALECAHTPAQLGETCDVFTTQCDTGLYCKAGLPQRCHALRRAGEGCGPFAPCVAGASCRLCGLDECDTAFQCFPDHDGTGLISPGLCRDLHSQSTHRTVADLGGALTVGSGLEHVPALPDLENTESGVVYGDDGRFGCYYSECFGLNADGLGIEAYVALGGFNGFDDVAGPSVGFTAEVQTPASIVNFATTQVFSRLPGDLAPIDYLGTVDAMAIGVSLNPFPASAATNWCETTVNLVNIAPPGGVVTLPAPAPASPSVYASVPAGQSLPPFTEGRGALFFDGSDDALVVSDVADLAALEPTDPAGFAAWQVLLTACRQPRVEQVPGCSPVVVVPTQDECVDGLVQARTEVTQCCALGGSYPSCVLGATVGVPVSIPPEPIASIGPQPPSGRALTMEAWIRPDPQYDFDANPSGQDTAIILNKEGEYEMMLADGELAWAIAYPGGWVSNRTGYLPPRGVWTHVAVVYDGAGVRTYVDGQAVHWMEGGGVIGDFHSGADEFRIGGRQLVDEPFAGQIDAVRIWATALTDQQIREGLRDPVDPASPLLLASWEFSELDGPTLFDDGPHAIDLALDGLGSGSAPVRSAEDRERRGGALAFDGINDFVEITEPIALDGLRATDALTIEAWVHPQGPGSGPNGGIIASREGEFWLGRTTGGKLVYALANTSPGWTAVTTSVDVPENEWNHVAFVYDGGVGYALVYLNGVLAETPRAASGPLGDTRPSENNFRIGGRQVDDLVGPGPGAGQRFQGVIDEVRFWTVARTDIEIASHHDRPVAPDAPGLAGSWRFDEGPSLVAFDDSAGRRHGTLGSGQAARVPKRTDALAFMAYPTSAAAPSVDADGDAIGDGSDNCTDVPNASQSDMDADGFGDACDCDFDGDGSCGITDFNLFLPDFSAGVDSGVGTDMNGDGVVGIEDFNAFLPGFQNGVPGPSVYVP